MLAVLLGMGWFAIHGCTTSPNFDVLEDMPLLGAGTPCLDNPLPVACHDADYVWLMVVDVVDDHFTRIARQQPIRRIGDVLTEGSLETFPQDCPTVLEPWRKDTADETSRMESTLQTMRHWAQVSFRPSEGAQQGIVWIDVRVYKELEDASGPEATSAGNDTFRYDESIQRVVDPVADAPIHAGWIPMGRETALEQKIIAEISRRLGAGVPGTPLQ